jgi:hypothetical protein
MAYRKGRRRSVKKGGELGIIGTAAVPLSLLALTKYYGSRKQRRGKSARSRKSRRSKSWW